MRIVNNILFELTGGGVVYLIDLVELAGDGGFISEELEDFKTKTLVKLQAALCGK